MTMTSLPAQPARRRRPPTLRLVPRHAQPIADRRPAPAATTEPDWAALLSAREHEVLQALARGLSNAEISRELVISVPTVKVHVAHLLHKTRSRDRLQLVVKAYRSGYLEV